MKALTVRQPWAELIAQGRKLVENRTWTTDYRGPLLIHSSAGSARRLSMMPDGGPPAHGKLGATIAIVDLVDVTALAKCAGDPFAEGPYCWILRNPRRVPPIFVSGKLGLWTPDAALLTAITH